MLLCGLLWRRWGVPSMLCDVGVCFDDHAELQIFSLIHLNWKTLVGQFGGQLGQQPDVGLVCLEQFKPFVFSGWTCSSSSIKDLASVTISVAYLQPAGRSLNCSPLLHSCQCRKCFLCLQGLQQRWSVCSVCPGDFLHWSEPFPLLLPSEDIKKWNNTRTGHVLSTIT